MGYLINFEPVLNMIRDYRVFTISGTYGFHKTSLAFRIGYEMYRRGLVDRIISNCPSIWSENIYTLNIEDVTKTRAFIILDEGGLFLRDRFDTESYLAFPRKLDIYMAIPTAKKPTLSVRTLSIFTDMRFAKIGLPLYRYAVSLEDETKHIEAKFYWLMPDTYGIYDTVAASTEAVAINQWLGGLSNRLPRDDSQQAFTATRAGSRARSGPVFNAFAEDESIEAVEKVSAALEEQSEALGLKLNQMERVQKKLDKKRGWRRLFGG